MFSIRLPEKMDKKLTLLAAREGKPKSEIVKDALEEHLAKQEMLEKPFELGKDLFGKYGSGAGNLAAEYKKIVREKIHAKKPN